MPLHLAPGPPDLHPQAVSESCHLVRFLCSSQTQPPLSTLLRPQREQQLTLQKKVTRDQQLAQLQRRLDAAQERCGALERQLAEGAAAAQSVEGRMAGLRGRNGALDKALAAEKEGRAKAETEVGAPCVGGPDAQIEERTSDNFPNDWLVNISACCFGCLCQRLGIALPVERDVPR